MFLGKISSVVSQPEATNLEFEDKKLGIFNAILRELGLLGTWMAHVQYGVMLEYLATIGFHWLKSWKCHQNPHQHWDVS